MGLMVNAFRGCLECKEEVCPGTTGNTSGISIWTEEIDMISALKVAYMPHSKLAKISPYVHLDVWVLLDSDHP